MPTAYVTAPRDRWDGDVHAGPEAVLLAKTTDAAYDRLVDLVVEADPYDVPCIERFDEADELDGFADWREGAVD